MTYQLTARVLKYQEDKEDLRQLENDIAILSYRYIHKNKNLNEDEAGDFFCLHYTKIMGLITQFKYRGRPFEAYLYVTIRWNMIRYRQKILEQRMEQHIYKMTAFWEVHQEDPPYIVDPVWETPKKYPELSNTVRKRIIYLALRESEYLNHAMIEELVAFLDIDRRWFMNCVMALKERTSRRRHRIDTLRTYRNKIFYQYHLFQVRIDRCADPHNREELKKKISAMDERLKTLDSKIRKAHLRPTNNEISEVLNVPKGTIDSGIFYLRQKFFGPENEKVA